MVEDRFTKLAHNYAEHFDEVFKKLGLDYGYFQKSMFSTVVNSIPEYKDSSILDVGCGDGESLAPFVEAGCSKLVGIDLNPVMIEASRKRFGNKVQIIKADCTNMPQFKPGQFDIIITGACIHNIPADERAKFWDELIRLKPKIFVAGEKIADPDPKRHKKYYDQEVGAIREVYIQHGLKDVADAWVEHYEFDEENRMTLLEMQKVIEKGYTLSVVGEFGMYKTVLAVRK